MADLSNVTRAFDWILAYYKDVAKIFAELQAQVTAQGFEMLTDGAMDTAQSKTLQGTRQWAATYCYQFFTPAGADDELLVVMVVGHAAGVSAPYVCLARFTGQGVRGKYREVTYWWNEAGAHEDPDAWAESAFKSMKVQHAWFPLSRIAGLPDVKTSMVDPLIALHSEAVAAAAAAGTGAAPPAEGE